MHTRRVGYRDETVLSVEPFNSSSSRLPADRDENTVEVSEQDVALDLRVLCGTGNADV